MCRIFSDGQEGIFMETKRQEIIAVAIRLLAEKDFEHTSVEEIAKESGMAKGSFYKYFQSKDELLIEIITQLPQKLKEELKHIYVKQYESTYDKLSDFVFICLESIFSTRAHLLMEMIFKLQLFKSKQIEKAVKQIERGKNLWIEEFLLDVYGDQIKEYIGDLVYLLKTLIMQYVHLSRHHKSDIDLKKLTHFIATMFDIMVEGLCERRPEAPLELDWVVLGACNVEDSPRQKGMDIQLLLHRMTDTVKRERRGDSQQEYVESLALLEEECTKSQPKHFLVKALIQFLETSEALRHDCQQLKRLLDIE